MENVATPQERVASIFNKLADSDGYVHVEGLVRIIVCVEGLDERDLAESQARDALGGDKKLASELIAGDVGQFLSSGTQESMGKLRQIEAAILCVDRVSNDRVVDAAAFAAADGEKCTRLLKQKVAALFEAVGADDPAGFTKDQLLKYAIGLAQSGTLTAIDLPPDAPDQVRQVVDHLFVGLDESCNGKVTQEEAFNFALKTMLEMAGCSSIEEMPTEMKMQLMMAVNMYCDLLLGAGSASGSDRLAEVTKMLKAAFDAADLHGNGFLERDELRAGCLVIAKKVSEMSGGRASVEEGVAEMEAMLDGFLAEADKEKTGKLRFEDMLAVTLPGLCGGQEPEKFFAEMDPSMFLTIKMQIDMYLGGFEKK